MKRLGEVPGEAPEIVPALIDLDPDQRGEIAQAIGKEYTRTELFQLLSEAVNAAGWKNFGKAIRKAVKLKIAAALLYAKDREFAEKLWTAAERLITVSIKGFASPPGQDPFHTGNPFPWLPAAQEDLTWPIYGTPGLYEAMKTIVDSPDFELKETYDVSLMHKMALWHDHAELTSSGIRALAGEKFWTLFYKGKAVAVSFPWPAVPEPKEYHPDLPYFNWIVPWDIWQGFGTISIIRTAQIYLEKYGVFAICALDMNSIGFLQITTAIQYLQRERPLKVNVSMGPDRLFCFAVRGIGL